MSNMELIDIQKSDIVVSFKKVSKIYTQWQRETKTKNLIKRFFKPEKKQLKAIDDISFNITKGEFVAYAGPNGAGKSTTMKIISAMLYQNGGEVSVLGLNPQKNRIELMRRMGVLYGNRTELWWDHPIMQSFEWKKVVWDIEDNIYKRRLDMLIELFELESLLKTYARELSLGQRMRADIALMLLHEPELIILDEPTLGLDVSAKRQMIEALKKVNRENDTTIFVTSHDMDDLEEMAQRIIMVSKGKLAFDGSFSDLRKSTGDLSTIKITGKDLEEFIDIGHIISAERDNIEIELDLSKTSVSELLKKISQIEGISDIEIKRAPIERVIDNLYKLWNGEG